MSRSELLKLPVSKIEALSKALIRKNYESLYGGLRTAYEVMLFRTSFASKAEAPDFIDLFPAWANPEFDLKERPYTETLISAYEHIKKRGFNSNLLMQKLDTNKLRESGMRG